MVELASQYGRYGDRLITGMLRNEDWQANHKRIERLWRREGLKVPHKQPKRSRLWLNDGSCASAFVFCGSRVELRFRAGSDYGRSLVS